MTTGVDTVTIKVLFFAQSREVALTKESVLLVPRSISYNELKNTVVTKFGLSTISNNILLALNQELCSDEGDTILHMNDDDEIAVIPPLSGG